MSPLIRIIHLSVEGRVRQRMGCQVLGGAAAFLAVDDREVMIIAEAIFLVGAAMALALLCWLTHGHNRVWGLSSYFCRLFSSL